ncbi:SYF2 [Cordylochernes scorpioides]|uniref:Pre-mRNA-splicing factor SYF2 n=1 Tax=Cordylochernes scorpioides TaxID=51811 RepID=A0ABY6KFW3_9ARAC|nr:SYF2 [Cordylochernes scorpioides]
MAKRANNEAVQEEHKEEKLPANYERKRKWAEWKLDEENKRQKILIPWNVGLEMLDLYKILSKAAIIVMDGPQYRLQLELCVCSQESAVKGEDYDHVKLLDIGAEEALYWERKKKKKNPDPGFSDFDAATLRQYQRLTKQIKPDMEEYNATREKVGDEAFYPTKDTIIHGTHKDTPEGVQRMVDDLNAQISKREKYSRRRRFNDDASIDYINERNMKFNKKLERFYGAHTAEIKLNLERGTAV